MEKKNQPGPGEDGDGSLSLSHSLSLLLLSSLSSECRAPGHAVNGRARTILRALSATSPALSHVFSTPVLNNQH